MSDDVLDLACGVTLKCAYVEGLCRELIPALDQVVVLTAQPHRTFALALCTLQLSEDLAGRLLGDDALALAKRSGSKANTLITARSCAQFRRGLQEAFQEVNGALACAGFPGCQVLEAAEQAQKAHHNARRALTLAVTAQIQSCHVLLSGFTCDDNTLLPSGEVHRGGVRRKHANLLQSLSSPALPSEHPAPGTLAIAKVRKRIKNYQVVAYDVWLARAPDDQQALVTKVKSSLQRGWDYARGGRAAHQSRKAKAPDTDIEGKILQLKAVRHAQQNETISYLSETDANSSREECALSSSLDLSVQRSRLRCASSGKDKSPHIAAPDDVTYGAVETPDNGTGVSGGEAEHKQALTFYISDLPSAVPPPSLSVSSSVDTHKVEREHSPEAALKPADSVRVVTSGGVRSRPQMAASFDKTVTPSGAPVKTGPGEMMFTMTPVKGAPEEDGTDDGAGPISAASFLSPATRRFLQCVQKKERKGGADVAEIELEQHRGDAVSTKDRGVLSDQDRSAKVAVEAATIANDALAPECQS